MKAMIFILWLLAAAAGFSALTGLQSISFSNFATTDFVYHSIAGRILAAWTSILFAASAWGCMKRRPWAWWLVAGLLGLIILTTAIWGVWKGIDFDLPMGPSVLGAVGEAIKLAGMCWVLFVFWRRRRPEFMERK